MATYTEFTKYKNITEKLLIHLGILTRRETIIRLNNLPDYDITKFEREIISNYFFHNSWDFSNDFQSIIEVEFLEDNIFHYDDLILLSKEYKIVYGNEEDNDIEFLKDVYKIDQDSFSQFGSGTDVGEFILHKVRLNSIDNINKQINYEGSFQGDSSDIDPLDWGIYSLIEITGISLRINTLPFYKSLLAESYILFKEGKFKLAYFFTYSALESFVNYEIGNNDPKRVNEKLSELFKAKFTDLAKHQIYSSVMNIYEPYTTDRNTIAHGHGHINITAEQVNNSLLFVLTLISSFEFNSTTFEELDKHLNLKEKK